MASFTPRVLLMEKVHDVAAKAFTDQGFEVIRPEGGKLSPEEFEALLPTIDIIGIRSKTKLPKELLEKATRLMAIGCYCIGTDCVDLTYARERGIPVFNSPYANTRSVAELVIAEMVMLARQAGDRSREMHTGEWNKKSIGCYEVRGKTLGIIGFGHVGMQLCTLAESMGLKVVFCDVVAKLALGNSQQVSQEVLLSTADFVTLHVPKLESTAGLIGEKEIQSMRKGSYLLNLARGNVVDNVAAAAALRSGHLAGAGFDVYPTEPAGHTLSFTNPLLGCPNTILTPHIGGSTEEAQEAIGVEVAGKVIKFINRGSTMGSVNVPQIDNGGNLEAGFTRVLNFHRDIPGTVRQLNNALTEGNITYQALRTGNGIGYIIVDIESSAQKNVQTALNALDSTICTYLLQKGSGYCGAGRR
eukprot:m.244704 g.244704  ORF g.244704 m.244704 type:complete len:415 (-) comp33833_c11_seq2:1951-3195(-)